MAASKYTVDFQAHFDPQSFLRTYHSYFSRDEEECFMPFFVHSHYDIFKTGNVKGRYLLDVGTGPSIHAFMFASCHVDEIYLSDLTSQNRAFLIEWWKGSFTIQDKITEFILEKEKSSQSVVDRQNMMKSKIRNILPIDVTLPHPIRTVCHVKKFDVITSSFCLESASHSIEEYCNNVRNVSSLLNVNGHFILNGTFGETNYSVGEFKFKTLPLTRNQVHKIFMECGFIILKFYERDVGKEMNPEHSDLTGYFVMCAKKIK